MTKKQREILKKMAQEAETAGLYDRPEAQVDTAQDYPSCPRCGSSADFEDCENCGGDGWVESPDDDSCTRPREREASVVSD